MNKVYIFLANGFEELEFITVIDIFRRANIDIESVSIGETNIVKGAHNIEIIADIMLKDLDRKNIKSIILPGGMPGAQNLSECQDLIGLISDNYNNNNIIAAICAAPGLVLSKVNLPESTKITTYPGFEEHIASLDVMSDGVVIDNNLITAKGPAFATDFAFAILSKLISNDEISSIKKGMLFQK